MGVNASERQKSFIPIRTNPTQTFVRIAVCTEPPPELRMLLVVPIAGFGDETKSQTLILLTSIFDLPDLMVASLKKI